MHKLKNELLEWREVEGEVVALDLRNSSYLGINKTGAVIWPLLAEGADIEALVKAVTERFDVDEPTARQDVSSFIEDLSSKGLIENL